MTRTLLLCTACTLRRHEAALERAEAALADEWLSCGYRLALQRRVLYLGALVMLLLVLPLVMLS